MIEMWSFKTKNFRIVASIEDDWDSDMSWDETGEVTEKLNSGEYQCFHTKVEVFLNGNEIGDDHLGASIYADPSDFFTEHRDPNPNNRNCTLSNRNIGHYFPQMVTEAIGEARATVRKLHEIKVRVTA